MSAELMSCAEAEPLLPLVADGAVDPHSDPQLFAHLAGCAACQRVVAEHDLIALALQRGASDRRRAAAPGRFIVFTRLALAAGIALAAGAVFWLLQPHPAHASATVAQAPAPAHVTAPPAAATPPAVAIAPAPTEVVRIPQADGSSVYLVHRADGWVAMDPALLDGPEQAQQQNADNHQVGLDRRWP